MSPRGRGSSEGGVGKRATEGDPKSKEEGRLGDYTRVEVKTQGERAPSYCSLASTLVRPTALAQGQIMDSYSLLPPCPLSFHLPQYLSGVIHSLSHTAGLPTLFY